MKGEVTEAPGAASSEASRARGFSSARACASAPRVRSRAARALQGARRLLRLGALHSVRTECALQGFAGPALVRLIDGREPAGFRAAGWRGAVVRWPTVAARLIDARSRRLSGGRVARRSGGSLAQGGARLIDVGPLDGARVLRCACAADAREDVSVRGREREAQRSRRTARVTSRAWRAGCGLSPLPRAG
jgi:hypothetical protein